jgi:hypothetical protein
MARCRSLHPGGPVPAARAGLRIWFRQTGRGTACQLFFPATAALRTVANAVHAISGTATAAAV